MAVNYSGSQFTSASRGAFAVYGASTAGADVIDLFDVVVGGPTAVVTNVPGAVQFTDAQLAAMGRVIDLLGAYGSYGGNEATWFQKVIGVLPLTAGVSCTFSVDAGGGVGGSDRFKATASAAGDFIIYDPNEAGAGLFTGSGATGSGGGSPTGPAGGILGYTGSTYPNPNGLAPIADTIPIKPGVTDVTFQVDDAPEGSVGCFLSFNAAKGGNADAGTTTPGKDGGYLQLRAGAGGDPDTAAGIEQPGGSGGAFTATAGDGGDGTVADEPGNGGFITITAGSSGANVGGPSGAKGIGGSVTIEAGSGADNGGSLDFRAGDGLPAVAGSTQPVGGIGGGVSIAAGEGGEGENTRNGGAGGSIDLFGATGGDGSGDPASQSGKGGDITLSAGSAGVDNGGGAGDAGLIDIRGGFSGTAPGRVFINASASAPDSSTTEIGKPDKPGSKLILNSRIANTPSVLPLNAATKVLTPTSVFLVCTPNVPNVTITNILGGIDGQVITILSDDTVGNTITLNRQVYAAGPPEIFGFSLSAASQVIASGGSITLRFYNDIWYEIGFTAGTSAI